MDVQERFARVYVPCVALEIVGTSETTHSHAYTSMSQQQGRWRLRKRRRCEESDAAS